jgi:hypothetical protein
MDYPTIRRTASGPYTSGPHFEKHCSRVDSVEQRTKNGYRKGHENEGEDERGLWDDPEEDGSPSCWKSSRERQRNWRLFVH